MLTLKELKGLKELIKRKTAALVSSEIAWWVMGLGLLVLLIIVIILSQKQGISLLEQIKNILRFRR